MSRRTGYNTLLALLVALALLLTACSDDTPYQQDDDPAILTGFDTLPKQIATVALTATPTPVIMNAEPAVVAPPTPTTGPPRATPTLTPYVGVFLGQPTSESGEPAPTLAPFTINSGAGAPVINSSGGIAPAENGGSGCSQSAAGQFAGAYAGIQSQLGCPINAGMSITPMVTQSFERGVMFWRGDSRQIYALASNGQYWQTPDTWDESMPPNDPAFSPPAGLLQPVRGFGFVWRNNPAIRDALGWATMQESQYSSFWQDFERGAMLLGENGRIYALFTAEGRHSGPLN